MKKEIIVGYVKIDMTKQVSKPKKQVAEQLIRRDLVIGQDGSLMDKHSFAEWEHDKRNLSFE